MGAIVELVNVPGLSEHTDDAFRSALVATAARVGIDPGHLAAAIAFETGKTFSPSIKNPGSSATGLIQFMAPTAIMLGTTVQALAQMTAVVQLEYVARYFERVRQGRSLARIEDVYLAILSPAHVGKPDGAAVFSSPSAAYAANKGLDRDGDGIVTVHEATAGVRALYAQGVARGMLSVSGSVSLRPWAWGLGVAAFAAAGAAALLRWARGSW